MNGIPRQSSVEKNVMRNKDKRLKRKNTLDELTQVKHLKDEIRQAINSGKHLKAEKKLAYLRENQQNQPKFLAKSLSDLATTIFDLDFKLILYQYALESNPIDSITLTSYATALAQAGNTMRAFELFEASLRIDPQETVTLTSYAIFLEINHDYKKAISLLESINLEQDIPQNGEDENTEGVCPAALGSKNQQPVSYSPQTGYFYISGNHLCMDYEPFEVSYTAGQPYVGATLTMMPAGADVLTGKKDGSTNLGQFTAWDAKTGEIKWSNKEQFSVWSGSVATAGGVVFYGTLEGYLKAVDAKTGKELYKFKTPSGIIGNVNTWSFEGRQYVGVLSGIGGWAGIGIAAGLDSGEDDSNSEGLGAVGAYRSLSSYTKLGGTFTVFALPKK